MATSLIDEQLSTFKKINLRILVIIVVFTASRSGSWEPPPETRRSSIPMQAFDSEDLYIRLYNIEKDPLERNNLAKKQPQIVHRLLRRLRFYNGKSKKPRRAVDHSALPEARTIGDQLAWRPWLA